MSHTLDPVGIADELRAVIALLAQKDWHALFIAKNKLAGISRRFTEFTDAAEAAGTAPSFPAQCDWLHRHLANPK